MTIMRSKLKNERGIFFLPHLDLNHGPLEPRASVLPMSYSDPIADCACDILDPQQTHLHPACLVSLKLNQGGCL